MKVVRRVALLVVLATVAPVAAVVASDRGDGRSHPVASPLAPTGSAPAATDLGDNDVVAAPSQIGESVAMSAESGSTCLDNTTADSAGPCTTSDDQTATSTSSSMSTTEVVATGRLLTVASIGDSNTASGYWRKSFQERADCGIDMVGNTKTHWETIDFDGYDAATDAVGGATIAEFRQPENAVFVHAQDTLATQPDVAVVLAGTNDMAFLDLTVPDHRDVLSQTIVATRQSFLDAAQRTPTTRFVLAAIPPIAQKPENSSALNALLRIMVTDLQADGVPITFIAPTVGLEHLESDGLHLTLEGGAVYGQAIAREVCR